MRSFLPAVYLRLLIRLWGPFLGAGIRIKSITEDYREVVMAMRLRWYNRTRRNITGSRVHYGGSVFSMTDPFYMMMLLKNLGPGYLVWDKAASIEFVKPGQGEVVARFELTEDRIREIEEETRSGRPHYAQFKIDVVDSDGDVVARVDKTVYVRKKPKKE